MRDPQGSGPFGLLPFARLGAAAFSGELPFCLCQGLLDKIS